MRAAAIDIGTNSTRLLIADVDIDGLVTELERHSEVTRLGNNVDATGRLDADAIERVVATVAQYRKLIDGLGAVRTVAVATSAVRDSANENALIGRLQSECGVAVDVIGGDEEAQLTFRGVTGNRGGDCPGRTLVLDIGGGSTEFIIGHDGRLDFHVSTQIGAVRQGERYLHDDPPTHRQMERLSDEIGELIAEALPQEVRGSVERGIAVAGTPTVLASIDQQLEVFDPEMVHGYVLELAACERMLAQLALLPLDERREVKGLHPDRAPTIVAGAAIIIEAMRSVGLEQMTVSEHDILYGLVLRAAGSCQRTV